ncbi:sulfite exporter TauE/SafE family protein [Neiella marina]|uniref:Probable membrane transporter protein n=1 Tax=Neiella holothuriorum TaxID=2870530 RepID=A0ABS7EJF5_9GAMM|nr:sulfite exporter TauE/SafE family protein [Neiella holothuriorum]MBW8192359.1 sulfite exporter TauE/SafE family protein [Neiella holothuriorum]
MIAALAHINRKWLAAAFTVLWLICVALLPEPIVLVTEHIKFSLLGLIGAVFANATGAGGGVVFIPAFHQLGFSGAQSVATSFAIQCFGMTAGALSWWLGYQRHQRTHANWQSFGKIIGLCIVGSVSGALISQYAHIRAPAATHLVFSVFSIILGLMTLYSCKRGAGVWRNQINAVDCWMISWIGLAGGMVTAWLSVGVGELLAVYLILRGYHLAMSIAAAVIVSAITVWSAIPYHVLVSQEIQWGVVLFAGPCAVIGGLLARSLVSRLSIRLVKLLFAAWVLLTGVFTLVLSA